MLWGKFSLLESKHTSKVINRNCMQLTKNRFGAKVNNYFRVLQEISQWPEKHVHHDYYKWLRYFFLFLIQCYFLNVNLLLMLDISKKQYLITLAIKNRVQFSCSVVFNSLRPHESQHARPPCLSPTPRVHSNSCPSGQWCHPAISSSVVPFYACPQTFPASESFPMSQLMTWGGQSTGASALASLLPKKSQGWSPLEWITTTNFIKKRKSQSTKNHLRRKSQPGLLSVLLCLLNAVYQRSFEDSAHFSASRGIYYWFCY